MVAGLSFFSIAYMLFIVSGCKLYYPFDHVIKRRFKDSPCVDPLHFVSATYQSPPKPCCHAGNYSDWSSEVGTCHWLYR